MSDPHLKGDLDVIVSALVKLHARTTKPEFEAAIRDRLSELAQGKLSAAEARMWEEVKDALLDDEESGFEY